VQSTDPLLVHGVLLQYSLLTGLATMRTSAWSTPIQNRINRSQGTSHSTCTIPLPSTALRAL